MNVLVYNLVQDKVMIASDLEMIWTSDMKVKNEFCKNHFMQTDIIFVKILSTSQLCIN